MNTVNEQAPNSIQTVANTATAPLVPIAPIVPVASQDAVLIAAALATYGWLYTARRARALARKQHTLNVMVQASFNTEFKNAEQAIFPLAAAGTPIDISDPTCPHREHFKTVLNHYEFVAQGIRNGDFDEQMVVDSLRGAILTLYERCEEGIFRLRTNRRRQTLYEHLEWLHCRWEVRRPGRAQRAWEWVKARPLGGTRKKPVQ